MGLYKKDPAVIWTAGNRMLCCCYPWLPITGELAAYGVQAKFSDDARMVYRGLTEGVGFNDILRIPCL